MLFELCRYLVFFHFSVVLSINLGAFVVFPPVLWSMVIFGTLIFVGYCDAFQKKQAIRRNFPILGNVRYIFEGIRPEINQYFGESNSDGVPFSREERSVIYQRAKGV